MPIVFAVAGLGCRRGDSASRSPQAHASPIAGDPSPGRSPTAEGGEGFLAYPGARLLCTQHVDGFTGPDRKQRVHFTWSGYVTTHSRDDVIEFFRKAHPGLGPDRTGGGFTLRTPAGANLSVHTAGTGAYPRCSEQPRAGERTVIIVGGPMGRARF
jgi:hypothetical protein